MKLKALATGVINALFVFALVPLARAANPTKVASKATQKASAGRESLKELNSKLAGNQATIESTEAEIKRIKDADFLPNLYFALADLYVEKSRLLYQIKIEKNPNVPLAELDFTAEKRPKSTAIEIYQKIYAFFTNFDRRDRALFYEAHEYHDLGQFKPMADTYKQLMTEFPDSPYWLEANLIMGDVMFEERKDADQALVYYKKVLARPINPFTSVAHYRAGWCYLSLNDQPAAFGAFDSALESYDKIDHSLLPETYKSVDLRREAVVALVFPYVEIYADRASNLREKLLPNKETPVSFFKRKSNDFSTYQKALNRLGRRFFLKNQWPEAAAAYLQIMESSSDPLLRWDSAIKFYTCFKKGGLTDLSELGAFEKQAVITAHDLATSSKFVAKDRAKNLTNFEVILRDIATSMQTLATRSKKSADFARAVDAYENYEWAFAESPFLSSMLINRAESEFNAGRWVDAGITYERVIARPETHAETHSAASGKPKKDFAEFALQSYIKALINVKELSLTQRLQARTGLRSIGARWLKLNPRSPAAAGIQFDILKSWFDERDFTSAIAEVERFLKAYPGDSHTAEAVSISLNSYSQLDDDKGLAAAGTRFLKLSSLSPSDIANVREVIRAARLKQVRRQAGEFGSKEYARNLKAIASENKGTDLGDQALYEAFISLKSKRDPQTYDAGEQLLNSHADSRYAQEVAGAMAQMAITTADFERAARYFEAFALKYPKEKESPGWLQNAANLNEWLGNFAKARELYTKLGNSESAARMDVLAGDWTSLAQTAKKVSGVKGTYWQALSLVRQNRFADARPLLQNLSRAKAAALAADETEMIAHAAYLLSSETLDKFKVIRMSDANDQKAFQNKIDTYQALSQQLNEVIKLKNGHWTIAALYGLGQANYSLASFIHDSPIPQGLDKAKSDAYVAELHHQASSYSQLARTLFGQCLTAAEEFEIFTRFVDGCRAQGKKEIDEARDARTQAPVSANDRSSEAVLKLRRALYDQPRDVATLLALAETYIDLGDAAKAAAIGRRVLEIDARNARAQATIGVADLYGGDLDRGYAELKAALELNPKEGIALWNIAGLMHEFKFQKKAALALKKARQVPRPHLLHPFARRLVK